MGPPPLNGPLHPSCSQWLPNAFNNNPGLIAVSGQGDRANDFGHGTFSVEKVATIHGGPKSDEAQTRAAFPPAALPGACGKKCNVPE
jgi:hypothetical protein